VIDKVLTTFLWDRSGNGPGSKSGPSRFEKSDKSGQKSSGSATLRLTQQITCPAAVNKRGHCPGLDYVWDLEAIKCQILPCERPFSTGSFLSDCIHRVQLSNVRFSLLGEAL
jgi:hypothetical protein